MDKHRLYCQGVLWRAVLFILIPFAARALVQQHGPFSHLNQGDSRLRNSSDAAVHGYQSVPFMQRALVQKTSEGHHHVWKEAPVRVWIDTVFYSPGETDILRDTLNNTAGMMVISGEALSTSFLLPKGADQPQAWDLYWTVRQTCYGALPLVAPTGYKRVSCMPGVEAFVRKQPLLQTLQMIYGELAFGAIIPRSYLLPSQYWMWRSWLVVQHALSMQAQRKGAHQSDLHVVQQQGVPHQSTLHGAAHPAAAAVSGDDSARPWVLKSSAHRGAGVFVVRQADAITEALNTTGGGYIAVQEYVPSQFLYRHRPCYLRLWAVITSTAPLRVHLFQGGVVVFGDPVNASTISSSTRGHGTAASTAKPHPQPAGLQSTTAPNGAKGAGSGSGDDSSGPAFDMFKVNYWTIEGDKLPPWSVEELRRHVQSALPDDPYAFSRMWQKAGQAIGLAMAAAAPHMRALALTQGSAADGPSFEVFGCDFLLSSSFEPVLVEVNSVPSLARLRPGPGVGALAAGKQAALAGFNQEKEAFMASLLALIGMPVKAPAPAAALQAPPPPLAAAAAAASSPLPAPAPRHVCRSPAWLMAQAGAVLGGQVVGGVQVQLPPRAAHAAILDPADPRDILWLYTTTLLPPTPPPVQQLLHHAGKLSKDRQAQILGPVTERSKWQDLLTAQLHEAYNITPRMQSLLLRMHPDAAAAARQVHRLLASTLCDTSAAQYEPDQARQAAAPSGTVNQHSTKGGTTRGGTTKGSEPDISPFEDMVLKAGTRRLQGMTHGSGPSRVKWKSVDDLYRCRPCLSVSALRAASAHEAEQPGALRFDALHPHAMLHAISLNARALGRTAQPSKIDREGPSGSSIAEDGNVADSSRRGSRSRGDSKPDGDSGGDVGGGFESSGGSVQQGKDGGPAWGHLANRDFDPHGEYDPGASGSMLARFGIALKLLGTSKARVLWRTVTAQGGRSPFSIAARVHASMQIVPHALDAVSDAWVARGRARMHGSTCYGQGAVGCVVDALRQLIVTSGCSPG